MRLKRPLQGNRSNRMTEPNFTLESAAAGVSSTSRAGVNILPAILTPVACIVLVVILISGLKACNYARKIRTARRSSLASRSGRHINNNPDGHLPIKYQNGDVERNPEGVAEDGRNKNDVDLYQKIVCSSPTYSIETAKSEDSMIYSPLVKHKTIRVMAEIHRSTEKDAESSHNPFSDNSATDISLNACV